AGRGAAAVVPRRAARGGAAGQAGVARGGQSDVDQRAGARAGLQAHVRHSAHRTDGGAARGQGVLVAGLGEDVAEATTRVGPADLGYSRMRLAVGRRAGTVGRARVVGAGVGIGAQVGAAHAGDERVAGRPLN